MKLICILLLSVASAYLTIEYSLAEGSSRRAVRHTVQWGPCQPGDDAWMSIRTDEVRTAWSDVMQTSRPYPFGFPLSVEVGIDCRPLSNQTLTCDPTFGPVSGEHRTVAECFPRTSPYPHNFDYENKVRARWAPLTDLLDTVAARMDSGGITRLLPGEDWSGACDTGAEFQQCFGTCGTDAEFQRCFDGRFVFGPEQSGTALYTEPLAVRVMSTDLGKFWDLSVCDTGVTGPIPLIDCPTACEDPFCIALDDSTCMEFDLEHIVSPYENQFRYPTLCVQRDLYRVVLMTVTLTDKHRLYDVVVK